MYVKFLYKTIYYCFIPENNNANLKLITNFIIGCFSTKLLISVGIKKGTKLGTIRKDQINNTNPYGFTSGNLEFLRRAAECWASSRHFR